MPNRTMLIILLVLVVIWFLVMRSKREALKSQENNDKELQALKDELAETRREAINLAKEGGKKQSFLESILGGLSIGDHDNYAGTYKKLNDGDFLTSSS